MNDEIRAFIVNTILDMGLGYELAEIQDDTVLGPEGLDMESLTMAELAVRVEDRFRRRVSAPTRQSSSR